jgi:hypothetical protein
MVGHGQRIAAGMVSELELALVVGTPGGEKGGPNVVSEMLTSRADAPIFLS